MRHQQINPTEIEAQISAPEWVLILHDVPGLTPAERILRGHAALKLRDKCVMTDAAIALKRDRSLFARGTLASLYADLGDVMGVLSIPLPARPPTSKADLHGAFWLHFARAIVYGDLKNYLEALQEYGEAAAAARWLKEQPKVQIIEMHVAHLSNQMGMGDPARIKASLLEAMSEGRRAWHTSENLVAAQMQTGNYQWAFDTARPGHHYHGLMQAMTGQGLPDTLGHTPPCNVARAWAALWSGEGHVRTASLRGDIMTTYGALAEAFWLAGDSSTAHFVPELLSEEPPLRPDQMVLWAAVQLQAFARGAPAAAPLDLAYVMRDGMERLHETQHVLAVLARLAPEALLLAAADPCHHPATLSAALTLVDHVRARPSAGIVEGYQQEPWRGAPGRVVNAGILLAGIERMVQAAVDSDRTEMEANWVTVRTQVMPELRPATRYIIGEKTLHCVLRWDERTLKA